MGGKSKKQTVGYKYYLGMHLGLCHGPIDKITRLQVDDRDVWSGSNAGGSITFDQSSLFGGDKREGGVAGTIDVAMGGPAQGQNSYLVSKLGALIPAYRGIVGLIFRQCYLGNNPYLKTWAARGQRVYVRQNGIAQWYAEKAGIPVAVTTTQTLAVNLPGTLTPPGQRTVGAIIANNLGYTFSASPDSIISFVPTPGGLYSAVDANGDGWRWPLRVMGDDDGNAPLYSVPGNPQYATPALALAAVNAHLETTSFLATGHSFYRIWTDLEGSDAPMTSANGGLSVTIAITTPIGLDLNPAHIISECLTDPDWGMGYTDADIDNPSFTASADTFFNEGLGISLLWDKQKDIDSFVQTVLQHVDAALYVSRSTGKFVLKPIRGDYDEGSLLLLDESNIITVDDPTRLAFGELTNSVTVNYWDSATGKDASLTITDTALVQQQGVVINSPLQYPGFTNARNATIAGQRDLRVLSSPLLSCSITADSDAQVLNIGDVFKFSWAKWGLVEVVMRVTGIAYGTGRNNRVKISCTQDVFDTDTNVSIVVPPPAWEDPSAPPTNVPERFSAEAPYYELVQALGQSDIDNKLLTHPEIGYVVAAGARPNSGINATLYTDDGTGYEDVGAFDFCPVGYLATAIGKTQTAFDLEDFADLAEVVIGTHVQIGDELMRVDSLDVNTGAITVGRGVLDTVPQEHAAGEAAMFWDQYLGFDPTEYVASEDINVKITPVSGAGVLPIEEAVEMTVTMDQRAARPYAPGDLRINGDSYQINAFYEGEVEVTWTDRDRTQQTSGTLIDASYGNIGPEAGTEYRIQVYVDDVLDQTIEPAVSPAAVTPMGSGLVRIEVHSKRDGLYSWQAPSHTFINSRSRLTEGNDERYTEDGDARLIED